MKWLAPNRWQHSSQLQFLLGALFGLFSLIWVPYALDNSAIIWVINSLEIDSFPIQNSQGAVSYIAILHCPSVLLDGAVPVTTVAATMKLILALLLAIVAKKLAQDVGDQLALDAGTIGYHALALQMVLLTTALAKYGIFDTGKETVFAVLFLFAFAANLIGLHRKADAANRSSSHKAYLLAALPLAAAMGFGAITVPYGIILVSLFSILAVGKIRVWRFGLCCIAVCAIPLIVSIHAMLDWSWLKASVPVVLGGICLVCFDNWFPCRYQMHRRLPFALLAIAIIGVVLMMPIRFHEARYPLDGNTTALELFTDKNKFFIFGVLGLVACLISLGRGTYQDIAGTFSFLLFPWSAMLTVLMVIQMDAHETLGLHPQNIWDWAKDVPRWLSGIYLAVLAMFVWHELTKLLAAVEHRRWANSKTLIVTGFLILLLLDIRTVIKRTDDYGTPKFSQIGGTSDTMNTDFVTWAYQAKKNKSLFTSEMDPVIVSSNSELGNQGSFFKMFGIHCSTQDSLPQSPRHNRRLWFVCKKEEVDRFSANIRNRERFKIQPLLELDSETVCALTPRRIPVAQKSNRFR